jgi:ABC transport system ATP-binding/permease protein
MAVLLSCESVSKSYGFRRLFENLSIAISDGERVGIIGPNGSGKSTLLEILAGIKEPDSGTVSTRKLVRIGYVPQESAFARGATVRGHLELAASVLPVDAHEREALVAETLGKVGFPDPDAPPETLSGGWKKRLAIAAELVKAPDVLLLDEPTNHVDLEGILWLEKWVAGARFASIIVSHDRYFLENTATHMAEINRAYPGGLFYTSGGYAEFLEKKEAFLEAQAQRQEALENRVRREIEWLRRRPKARATKSKARIESAGRLMDELAEVSARGRSATAQIDFTASDRRTKKLVAAENLEMALGGRTLFRGLDFTLRAGTRVGLVGPNGSGKTTLLRLIAGELAPTAGVIERAEALQVVTFEQDRDVLDPQMPLKRALAADGDIVIFRDRPIHVAGWAKRFLFDAQQLEMPVASLSGGERARVLIARLMLCPADLLLLDEPTNDLDIPTLELLEDNLLDFPGALVLVTHDRYMLDRVSTWVLGLDGSGGAGVYADYSQWEQGRQARAGAEKSGERPRANPANSAPPAAKKKLSYLEQREWEQMESLITEAEAELERSQAALQDPDVVTNGELLMQTYEQLQAAQSNVDKLYARWAELEEKR